MPDHAKQVGVLCQHVIDLLGLTMKEGQSILLGESNIAHMVSNHPADYALYGEYIPLILSAPDYVALNAKDSSIEYVKEVVVYEENGYITAELFLDTTDTPDAKDRIKADVNEINRKMPTYKQVARVKTRDTEFPKTTTLKILRNYKK